MQLQGIAREFQFSFSIVKEDVVATCMMLLRHNVHFGTLEWIDLCFCRFPNSFDGQIQLLLVSKLVVNRWHEIWVDSTLKL